MIVGFASTTQSNVALALAELILRVENRRDKGDWQLSGDDSKALHFAKLALADLQDCGDTPIDALRMVGG